jgi:hypothetical protein
VFRRPAVLAETVDGEALVDWVTRLVEGEPVGDEHCRKCRATEERH